MTSDVHYSADTGRVPGHAPVLNDLSAPSETPPAMSCYHVQCA